MNEERLFTKAVAEAELRELRVRLPRLREARQRLIDTSERITSAVEIDGGGVEGSDWFRAQETLKRELLWLADRGILLRDADTGLVDFPADRDGQRVFLCWRLGEERDRMVPLGAVGLLGPEAALTDGVGCSDGRARHRRSRDCASPTVTWRRFAGSISTSTEERSSRCSARTAPGRRRRSRSSRATANARPARSRCSAEIPPTRTIDLKGRVGIVLQSTGVDPYLTARETVDLYAGYYPSPRDVDEVLDLVGLAEKRTTRVSKLSGGQQRRLDVAIALAGDPELLFLDEPTTGFDPNARRHAWEIVRNLADIGKTIFLTTHFMDEAQYLASRVAVIAKGEIVAEGTPETIAGRDRMQTRIRFRLPEGDAAGARAHRRDGAPGRIVGGPDGQRDEGGARPDRVGSRTRACRTRCSR